MTTTLPITKTQRKNLLCASLDGIGIAYDLSDVDGFAFARFATGNSREDSVSISATVEPGTLVLIAQRVRHEKLDQHSFWVVNNYNRGWKVGRVYHEPYSNTLSASLALYIGNRPATPHAVRFGVQQLWETVCALRSEYAPRYRPMRSQVPIDLDLLENWVAGAGLGCSRTAASIEIPCSTEGGTEYTASLSTNEEGLIQMHAQRTDAIYYAADARYFAPIQTWNAKSFFATVTVGRERLLRTECSLPAELIRLDPDLLQLMLASAGYAALHIGRFAQNLNPLSN